MNGDGSDVRRLTDRVGPDGGPFWSRDGQRIVFRGRPIAPGKELDDYRDLLKQGLWRPTSLELFVMNRDGSGLRQVTKNGAANFAPYFTPDGRQIVFASNAADPRGRNFDVYLVNVDGTGLEQVTFNETFDGFPMFSPDGTKVVFASNRFAAREGDTNVFIADWVASPARSEGRPAVRGRVRRLYNGRPGCSDSNCRGGAAEPGRWCADGPGEAPVGQAACVVSGGAAGGDLHRVELVAAGITGVAQRGRHRSADVPSLRGMAAAAAFEHHAIPLVVPQHFVATHATGDLPDPPDCRFHQARNRDAGLGCRPGIAIAPDEYLGIVRDHKRVLSPPSTG